MRLTLLFASGLLALGVTARGVEGDKLCAAVADGDAETVTALLKKVPTLAHFKTKDGSTPLHIAAKFGSKEIVDLLLNNKPKADVNALDSGLETPLFKAVRENHIEIVKALIAQKCDINARNTGGDIPLSVAANHGFLDICELLLDKNSKLDNKNKFGTTPLQYAVNAGHKEVVSLLRKRGAKE